MTKRLPRASPIQALLISLITLTPAFAQGERGDRGIIADGAHASLQVFHQLFDHRTEINRWVLKRQDGVETVTQSENPEVTRLLQTHVASMLARVNEGRPIHLRDPLFAELFRYADRIQARYELTDGGVRMVETSRDAYVVKLLQAHAEVVTAFITNGMSEMLKNHPLPPREP
jgi:hypothetical protein